MGVPPEPWREFLRNNWKWFLILNIIFFIPYSFIFCARREEERYNARQKKKEQKRKQYQNKDRQGTY